MANPVTWFEIIGRDPAGLHKFYKDVFGWKLTAPVAEMGNYSMLEDHEPGIGGGIGGDPNDQARVSIYIETADPQGLLEKAQRAGARVLMPVTTITPDTTIAMLMDPSGNTFGLLKANPRRPAPATAARRATSRARSRKKAPAKRKTAKKTSARKTTARKRTKRR